jgi:hypothetical protein
MDGLAAEFLGSYGSDSCAVTLLMREKQASELFLQRAILTANQGCIIPLIRWTAHDLTAIPMRFSTHACPPSKA